MNMMLLVIGFIAVLGSAAAGHGRGCLDILPTCPSMKSMCRVHVAYLKKWCPKMCGHCIPTPPPYTIPPGTQGPMPECGKPQVQMTRVISGTDAVAHSWPWQIRLLKSNRGMCGGTLVHPSWVVTAAHCVFKYASRPDMFKIRVGDHDLLKKEGTESEYKVAKVIVHPGWAMRTLDSDIALLKLSRPVIYTKEVSPACLPTEEVPAGTKCYITGWGKINHPGRGHPILQQAQLTTVSQAVCEAKNKQLLKVPVTERMICAGDGGVTRKSGCHGDSGGPFVCQVGGRWELHGAVSHGSPRCSSSEAYTVFARVTAFKSWIDSSMRDN